MAKLRFAIALLLSMSFFALAAWAGIAFISAQHEANTRDRQNSALISQNANLIAEIKADNADAAKERAALLANQKALLSFQAKQDGRLAAVLAYLKRHGIKLPTRLVQFISPPRLLVVTVSPKVPAHHPKHDEK